MSLDAPGPSRLGEVARESPETPVIIASILREQGTTGVNTHVLQLLDYLERTGTPSTLLTPFSWARPLTVPVFGVRMALLRLSRPASVVWYRQGHEVFLQQALRRQLRDAGPCVIYAQGPVEARAALRARRGPHQRIVMAVHFQTSQADEWASKKDIEPDGRVFRKIRAYEREVILQLDALVFVTDWARDALVSWLPEAADIPSAVIGNFVSAPPEIDDPEPLGDLATTGALELAKNHRYLLRVLAEAKAAGRPLTLDIYGEGPYRAELEELARSLGVDDQVRLRGFRRDVREQLPRYRAYVHASYVESASIAIIEAMAAGLPIVAGEVGGIPHLCDEGVEARFWPLDDAADAATTLIELLDDEATRRRMGAAAERRFTRDFATDVLAPRLRSFLLTGVPPDADSTPTPADAAPPPRAEVTTA
jgi:glycosyltransferase involved in cell wall biosynthesis